MGQELKHQTKSVVLLINHKMSQKLKQKKEKERLPHLSNLLLNLAVLSSNNNIRPPWVRVSIIIFILVMFNKQYPSDLQCTSVPHSPDTNCDKLLLAPVLRFNIYTAAGVQ